ncbi:hypothetical protein BDW66DRAFT_150650 [Aspergillus desertorum]
MPIAVQDPTTTAPTAVPGKADSSKGHPQPTLPGLVRVQRSALAFGSSAISEVSLPAGALFTKITTATPSTKAYSSVQVSRDGHIELNSDLVYCNHSCDPTVNFDMARMEVRVVDDRPLKKGDPLTFFYPSSEWEMDQPFQCTCGAGEKCKGFIKGAKGMGREGLKGYWLNGHIEELVREEEEEEEQKKKADGQ